MATANMPIMHQCTVTGARHRYILLSVCTSVKRDEKCTVSYGLGVERGGEEDRLSILDVGLSN